jgi:hypothetical protein
MTKDQIESVLDKLIRAHGKTVRAAIDAGACQTSHDYRKAHEAEAAYCEVYEATVATLTNLNDDEYSKNVQHFLRSRR